jgi:AraC-like DNA-binding protein
VLQPEWGNLRFRLENDWTTLGDRAEPRDGEIFLFGPTSRARRFIARPGAVIGVGFTPIGWSLLIGSRADEAADQVIDATGLMDGALRQLHHRLLGAPDDDARFGLLEAFFDGLADRSASREDVLRRIHACLLDPAINSVAEFAACAGLSQIALSRACLRVFGFTPKLLLQRQRFMRTLAALGGEAGVQIGELIDAAYVDHSHFNRDFRRFMGMSPSEYLALPRLILRAAMGSREKALGAALQGLHALGKGTGAARTG